MAKETQNHSRWFTIPYAQVSFKIEVGELQCKEAHMKINKSITTERTLLTPSALRANLWEMELNKSSFTSPLYH